MLLLFLLAGLCASALMWWMTARGAGVSCDSTRYMGAAENLLAGRGLQIQKGLPLTHYPPAYPVLLLLTALLTGGDMTAAARALAVLLFGANTILFGLVVYVCTRRSVAATVCAILFFVLCAANVRVHSMAWSEALFITFCLAMLLLLYRHVGNPTPLRLLLTAAAAGAAILTRYIGLTLLPPLAIILMVYERRPVSARARSALVACGLALVPLLAWFVRNALVAETVANRPIVWHPMSWRHVARFVISTVNFVLPLPLPLQTKILLGWAACIGIIGLILLRRRIRFGEAVGRRHTAVPAFCVLFAPAFVAFLALSISVFDAATSSNFRMLIPFHLLSTAAGVFAVWSVVRRGERQALRLVVAAVFAVTLMVNAHQTVREGAQMRRNGRGYAHREWRSSATIDFVAKLRPNIKLYSNAPDALRYLTPREAVWLPFEFSPYSLRSNEQAEQAMERIRAECMRGEAVIVDFEGMRRPFVLRPEEVPAGKLPPVLRRFEDGVVYGVAGAASPPLKVLD